MFQCSNSQKYLFVSISRSFCRLNLKKPRALYITVFLNKSVKHYSYRYAWWVALSLIWVQYSLKYARSNANRFKRVWVFLMCALFFAPIWKNLITNYLYTVQVTIWSKEWVLKIWLIRFLVKALFDFFIAWTHFISNERIYIYWSCFGKLGYKLVVLGKTGYKYHIPTKVRGKRFWYLKHCWFQIVTKVIGDK